MRFAHDHVAPKTSKKEVPDAIYEYRRKQAAGLRQHANYDSEQQSGCESDGKFPTMAKLSLTTLQHFHTTVVVLKP